MHESKTKIQNTSGAAGRWRLADVIDFEFMIEQDRDRSAAELDTRDRQIFQDQILPQTGRETDTGQTNRRSEFLCWLDARRKSFGEEQLLPGELSVASWRMLLKWIAFVGALLGAGAAANLLSYDGRQPVNVAAFLGWLVLVQIILVVIAGGVVVLRKTRFLSTETSLFGALVRSLWSWLSVRIHRHALSRVSAEQRTQFAAFVGGSVQHRTVYGEVALWPVAGSLQLFGVFFNLGALVTTIAVVVFSDVAFGWQSAVNFSSEQIHQLTQTLAAPWSRAFPDAAPTLEQIEGSKIVLKDGIRQLATGDLVSWWPFLCLSLAVYGLLPRVILWGATFVFGRRALRNISFNHAACDRLNERLHRPGLETSGTDTGGPLPNKGIEKNNDLESSTESINRDAPAIALMNEELLAQVSAKNFAQLIRDRFLLNVTQTIDWSDDSQSMARAIEQLQSVDWSGKPPVVVLLEEAWQPPIAEKLQGIRTLRSELKGDAKIIVVLVGRPRNGDPLTAVKPANKSVWERQIQSLGDTQLRVEMLIKNE